MLILLMTEYYIFTVKVIQFYLLFIGINNINLNHNLYFPKLKIIKYKIFVAFLLSMAKFSYKNNL